MALLRFRILLEDYDDIQYDIEMKATQTFQQLFDLILKTIQFDQIHEGNFFLADYSWRKGKSVATINGSEGNFNDKVEIVEFIDDPHQKFLFEYDSNAFWNFQVELIKVSKPDTTVDYPRLVNLSGLLPTQYKETLIIPTRERAKKEPNPAELDDLIFAGLMEDEEEEKPEELAPLEEDEAEPEVDELIEIDTESLETDNDIAQMGGAIIEADEMSTSSGFEDESDDEYGDSSFGDDDDYGSGGGGYRDSDDDY